MKLYGVISMINIIFSKFLDFTISLIPCLLGIWFCWKVLSNPFNFDIKEKRDDKENTV